MREQKADIFYGTKQIEAEAQKAFDAAIQLTGDVRQAIRDKDRKKAELTATNKAYV